MQNVAKATSGCELAGRTKCRDMARVPTTAAPLSVGPKLVGVEQVGALRPHFLTMQHYANRFAIVAEKAAAGDEVTVLSAYELSGTAAGSAGVAAWSHWASSGEFAPPPRSVPASSTTPLYSPSAQTEMASAVSIKATVPAYPLAWASF